MFLHVAKSSGLDPLRKQIWFVKRSGTVTMQASIDGLQARAHRHPRFRGIKSAVVCEKDDFLFDEEKQCVVKHIHGFVNRGAIVGAWCIVAVEGKGLFTALVDFGEFNSPNSPLWRTIPKRMIDKVARSTALRMAFPEEFSSIYGEEEMHQADNDAKPKGQATQELKDKLLAADVVVDQPPITAPKEQSARKMVIIDETAKPLTPRQRVVAKAKELGLEGKRVASIIAGATGKKAGTGAELTDDDAERAISAMEIAFELQAALKTKPSGE
jgi:phage recombination protein Bet